MAWAKVQDNKLESSIVKYLNESIQKEIIHKTKAKKGDMLMFVADKPKIALFCIVCIEKPSWKGA